MEGKLLEDLDGGAKGLLLHTDKRAVEKLRFSPDGRYLLCFSVPADSLKEDGWLRVWDRQTAQLVVDRKKLPSRRFVGHPPFVFSKDSQRMFSAIKGKVEVLTLASGKTKSFEYGSRIDNFNLLDDDTTLLIYGTPTGVDIWNTREEKAPRPHIQAAGKYHALSADQRFFWWAAIL